MSNRTKAYLALFLNSILWGVSAPIIKNAMGYVSPLYFLTYRFIMVILIVTPIFLYYLSQQKIKITFYRRYTI